MKTLYFEHPQDWDNALTIVAHEKGIEISVAQEQAVDSYGSKFECSFILTFEQAAQVRDFIDAHTSSKVSDSSYPKTVQVAAKA